MQGERFQNVSVQALKARFEQLAQLANAPFNANHGGQPRMPPPVLRQVPAAAAPPAAAPLRNAAAVPAADAADLRRLAPNRPALVAAVLNMPPLMNQNGANVHNPLPPPAGGGNRPLLPAAGLGNQPLQPPAAVANRPPAGPGIRPLPLPVGPGNRPPG